MNKYKVMKIIDGKIFSPYEGMEYELNNEYECKNFDENINNDCSNGFYATPVLSVRFKWQD